MNASPDLAPAPAAAAAWNPLEGRTLSLPPDGERMSEGWALRDGLGERLLTRAMQRLGAFTEPGREHSAAALADELDVAAVHRRLWDCLVDIVVAAGFVERDGDVLRAGAAVAGLAERYPEAGAEQAEVREIVAAHPEIAGQVRLLTTVMAEYPRLLRGEAKPVVVMFPASSMELVEGVYRGDEVGDRLNELVAESVAAAVDAAPGRPVRILEVGSGTGGTTTQLLATVRPDPERCTYTYTDIAASFLRHGRGRFEARYPAMDFQRLDIEGDMAAQGFEPGGYDVVVAANVLHATRDLPRSLANAAYLLRDGGRLVLREITTALTFTTMTFGLLDGWWQAEDGLRIPGSPLADVPTWTRLLDQAGFTRIAPLAPTATHGTVLGQHVLVAEL